MLPHLKTLLRLNFIDFERKVNSVRSKVLNDYGLGGEKSTHYKHICPGHSSPEMQKTQGIDIYNFIYNFILSIIVRAMLGTRSRTRSPPATSRSAPPSPRRPRPGLSFLICKLQATDNIWIIQSHNTQEPMLCA